VCGWGASVGRTLFEVATLLQACFAKNSFHRHRLLGEVRGVAWLGLVHPVKRSRVRGLVGVGDVELHEEVVPYPVRGDAKMGVDHRNEQVDEGSLFGSVEEGVRGGGWDGKSGVGVVGGGEVVRGVVGFGRCAFEVGCWCV